MSDVGFRSVMCGLFLAAALGVLLTRRRDRWVTRRAQRFAVETHSWVAGEDCLELERRVVASEPPLGIMLVGLAALTWTPGSGRSGDEVVGLTWVVWLILVLVATMGRGLGPAHPAARTAAPVAGDWISRPLRLTAALAVLVPVVGTVLRQHQSADLTARSLGWLPAGSMVVGLARWEMLLRRPTESARGAVVEGRTLPPANASWRDAWRGWLLANRCLALGITSVAISGLSLPRSPSPTPGDSAVDLVLRILSVAVGVALLLAYHHGRVHVRRRLWPDLPPIGASGSVPGC